jgi:acetyl-CoA carboxylase carboxyl transferase subunit alpha
MFEHAVYSVISPEGCAAILWKDSAKAPDAAENLRLTAENLLELGIVDEVIGESADWRIGTDTKESNENEKESEGFQKAADILGKKLLENLNKLEKMPIEKRLEKRYQKFRKMGSFVS